MLTGFRTRRQSQGWALLSTLRVYLLAGGLFEWTLTVHGRSLAIASLFSLRVSLLFVNNRLVFGAVFGT